MANSLKNDMDELSSDEKLDKLNPEEIAAFVDSHTSDTVVVSEHEHRSAIELLRPKSEGELVLQEQTQKTSNGHGVLNFFLLLLILGVGACGIYYFYTISNEEALSLRKARQEERKQEQIEAELAKQKRYGVMRVESDPPQAVIFKNGKQMIAPKPDAPKCVDDRDCGADLACDLESKQCGVPAKTPANISNMNIADIDEYVLKKPGYEDFDFHVSEHLWTKDIGSGDYHLLKVIDMNELPCEYWFMFDSAKSEEVKFPMRRDCDKAHDAAVAAQTTVTECTCKPIPEPSEETPAPAEPATPPAE